MPSKYAIRITEKNLDLITALNNDAPVEVEDDKTYFIVMLPDASNEYFAEIRTEDDLYKEDGHAKEEMTFIG